MTAKTDTPRTDAYPCASVEKQIHEALNPKGMSVHDGKVKLETSHVTMIIARSRALEQELAESRAQVAANAVDAARYRDFRKMVSTGNVAYDKKWRSAYEQWFAKFYPEDHLDAVVDAARFRTEPTKADSGAVIDSAISVPLD